MTVPACQSRAMTVHACVVTAYVLCLHVEFGILSFVASFTFLYVGVKCLRCAIWNILLCPKWNIIYGGAVVGSASP